MNWQQWRGSRRLVAVLTLLAALAGAGLLLKGLAQDALAVNIAAADLPQEAAWAADKSDTLDAVGLNATEASSPTAQIDVPWDNQRITERGQFIVEGRAWTPDQSPEFPDPPVLDEIVYQDGRDWYFLTWDPVADALSYVVEEARDPSFSSTTSYGPIANTQIEFDNKTNGTYYYRAQARNAYGESFWSNVVSVTVTGVTATSDVEATSSAPVLASVAAYEPVVEVNIKPVTGGTDNWMPATVITSGVGDWWEWTYTWDLPEEDGVEYLVQARAKDLEGGFDPQLIDTVTVTVDNGKFLVYMPLVFKRWPPIPYPPSLKIDSDNGQGDYQLSWTYPYTEFTPTSYRFQESTASDFSVLTINEIRTSPQSFTDKPSGTYYYRVRGINSYGEGEWSNVVQVVSAGFSDNFSDPNSGWIRKVYYIDDRPVFDANYENGTYRAKILRNDDGLNNYKMGIVRAPWTNTLSHYQVEVDHYFAVADDKKEDPVGGKGGLIFGATSDFKTLFVAEINFEGQCAVSKLTNVDGTIVNPNRPGNGSIYWWGSCAAKAGYNQTNVIKAVVNGNIASVYVNGQLVKSFTDNDLYGAHQVGFLSGSWERTPVEGRFDNFEVKAP